MTLRNNYVHFNEASHHNRIGVYFDRDYPLVPTSKETPAIAAYKQIFQRPNLEAVKKAFMTSNNFVDYLKSLFIPQCQEGIMFLMEQNPIGYTETKKVYSTVANEFQPEFDMT